MAPDEAALLSDLEGPNFRLGVLRGKWELAKASFPHAYFRVGAPTREKGPRHFLLRSECSGYKAVAPTSQLWDGRTDAPLPIEMRPHGKAGVMIAFTNWKPCLYHPIDRQAREHWPNQFVDLAWTRESDINTLLETVHALINHPEYLVSTAPEAAAYLQSEDMEIGAS